MGSTPGALRCCSNRVAPGSFWGEAPTLVEPANSSDPGGSGTRSLIFLGTGTSSGVPTLGCDCAVCNSADPRDNRTRASVLMRFPAGNLLIDTTPEMRIQLLREKIRFVHAIAFTHHHADHLFGLDDARIFPKAIGGPVPVFCEETTEECIRRAYAYAFTERSMSWPAGFVPKIDFIRIAPGVEFNALQQHVLPIRLEHGRFKVLGFRVGNLAYCTDVNKIPDESMALLEGLDTLILDALRPDPHPTHFSLAEALEVVDRVRPGRTYLTHISHSLGHEATEAGLPAGVRLAFDGLTLDF